MFGDHRGKGGRMEHKKLEKAIGYVFKNKSLLDMALRHSSYINEHHMKRIQCNERLEFLGDAVLEMVSSEFLYNLYPEKPEGELSKLRASLVCEPSLAVCARELGLDQALQMGKGEESTGGRQRDSIISDSVEATIGAIFLDGGITNAKEFILKHVLNDIDKKRLFYDSKTILQELVQGHMEGRIHYELVKAEGPDHAKSFYVDLYIGESCYGQGMGRTKKAAEQKAAYMALCRLREKTQEGKENACI